MKFVYTCICLAWVFSACSARTEPNEEALEANARAQKPSPIRIAIETASEGQFFSEISASGKIYAAQALELSFPLSGQVQSVEVKNGDFVKKGDIIARLSDENARINLLKASHQLKEKEVEFQNQLMGFSQGLQGESREQIINTLRYTSGLVAAEIALKEAEIQLANATLKAPFAGTIANLSLSVGAQVGGSEVWGTLYNPQDLIFKTQVLETEMAFLSRGLKANLKPLSNPQASYSATLRQINPMVDASGLVEISLRVDSAEGLVPGMNASALLRIPGAHSLLIPKEALVIRSGKAVVFTEENGLAKWNYVETGHENATQVAITSGLKAGDRVIVQNNQQLAHDSPVQLATPAE